MTYVRHNTDGTVSKRNSGNLRFPLDCKLSIDGPGRSEAVGECKVMTRVLLAINEY